MYQKFKTFGNYWEATGSDPIEEVASMVEFMNSLTGEVLAELKM